MNFKNTIKSILLKFGFRIIRYNRDEDLNYLFFQTIKRLGIDCIFDIGANRGQYGQHLRSLGYSGKIISFEPIKSQHEQLLINSQNDDQWDVYERGAIGNIDGKIEINISSNFGSSSILPMSKLHEESAPDSQYISKEEVPILTIDTVFKKHNFNYSNLFLKLDVQGYEEQVLNGAVQNISKFKGVICELSLAHLYDNTISWIDLVKKIEELGFNLWSIYPGFTDSKNGRMLQIDALFIRNGN